MTKAKKKARRPRIAHPMDVALGARIRQVREQAEPRVSQDWLARECSFSFQQLQKYEAGLNRVSFSRLCEIAAALNITVIALIAPLFEERP